MGIEKRRLIKLAHREKWELKEENHRVERTKQKRENKDAASATQVQTMNFNFNNTYNKPQVSEQLNLISIEQLNLITAEK